MLLAWDNKADGAALTVGSEIATLPGTNVQNAHLSKKWNTVAGVKSSYMLFDFGAQVPISALAVLGTNLTSAATHRLRASATDAAVTGAVRYDSGNLPSGIKAGYAAVCKVFNAPYVS